MPLDLPSALILALVLLCAALAVGYLIRHRGGGCFGCAGDCARCKKRCRNRK